MAAEARERRELPIGYWLKRVDELITERVDRPTWSENPSRRPARRRQTVVFPDRRRRGGRCPIGS